MQSTKLMQRCYKVNQQTKNPGPTCPSPPPQVGGGGGLSSFQPITLAGQVLFSADSLFDASSIS